MYRFIIFDEKIDEVQRLRADAAVLDGTVVAFSTDGEIEMLYNLPPGYSILKEEI